MTGKEIINKYNTIDCKPILETDLYVALGQVPDVEKSNPENYYENVAFALSENDNSDWGSYYGPLYIMADGSCFPAKEDITSDAVNYWEIRHKESVNPVIRGRYSGLIYEFKQSVSGQKVDPDIIDDYLSQLITSVEGDYFKNSIIGFQKLTRAMDVAIRTNKPTYINKIKKAFNEYELRHAKDKTAGLWGSPFLSMLDHFTFYSEEEQILLVTRLEERVRRLMSLTIDGEDQFDQFTIEQAISLLARYYSKKQDKKNLKRVLDIERDAFHKAFPKNLAMQKITMLEMQYQLYKNYNYTNEADATLVEIQTVCNSIPQEMHKTTMPFEINREQFDEFVSNFTQGTLKENVERTISHYIPIKNELKKELLDLAKEYPFQFLITKKLFDYKGRPMSVIGDIEDDLEGNLVQHISQSMNISHIFLDRIIHDNIKLGIFTTDSIMGLFDGSPIIEKNRYVIFRAGVQAFFDGNYLVSLHLLIPQIENAIRNLVDQIGGSVIKPQKSGHGFQLRTFDEILRDNLFITSFGEDFPNYLKVLFTDQRGWNLRNIICHGIAPIGVFNAMNADRVFHVIMCLSQIRFINNTN